MKTPTELCAEIHRLLDTLPVLRKPSEVPFEDGLYFFYEKGETSPHAPNGRIVRVGNHPRSDQGLKRRLMLHYSRNKNSSVFRKFLGGAILRSIDANHPCLSPGPGQGHWEKQGLPTCELCRPVENDVSKVLRSNFWFRCVKITNRNLRNLYESKLIATISLCNLCKPSDSWLGKRTYSRAVQDSGLWNSDDVFDLDLVLDDSDLEAFRQLVADSLARR